MKVRLPLILALVLVSLSAFPQAIQRNRFTTGLDGATVNGNTLNNLTATNASASTYGVVKVDGTTVVATNGVLSAVAGGVTFTNGSSTVHGVVQVDGTSITAVSGVISANVSGTGFPLSANGNANGFHITNGFLSAITNDGSLVINSNAIYGPGDINMQVQSSIHWFNGPNNEGGIFYNFNHSVEQEMQFDSQGSASFTLGEDAQGKADCHFGGTGSYHTVFRMQSDDPWRGLSDTNLFGQSTPFGFTMNTWSNGAAVGHMGAWQFTNTGTNGDGYLGWHDRWNPPNLGFSGGGSANGYNQSVHSPYPDHLAGGFTGTNIFWNDGFFSNNVTVGGGQQSSTAGFIIQAGGFLQVSDADGGETAPAFIVNPGALQTVIGRLSGTSGKSDSLVVQARDGSKKLFIDNISHAAMIADPLTLSNGVSSLCFTTNAITATGFTNAGPVEVRVMQFTGTSCYFSNITSGVNYSVGTISSPGMNFILQINECLVGSSCASPKVIAF